MNLRMLRRCFPARSPCGILGGMSTRGERTNCGDDPAAAHLTGVSYVVRESARAKCVRLRMSHDEGLVVVVPKGFNRRRIAAIIDE